MTTVVIADPNAIPPHLPNKSLNKSDFERETDIEKEDFIDGSGTNSLSDSSSLSKYYIPPDSYESKHRWDPTATWTPEEQQKIRRKLDWRVTLVACVSFAALQLDRSNITQALSDNFLKDLKLTTNDYNTGQTIFYVCFLAAELPSQLISKKLGSDVWIPIQMMAWSAVAIGQCGLKNRAQFYATRALLGLWEGGFIADTILYLSYYFTSNELTIRLSFFWVSLTSANIISALLAGAILNLRGQSGLSGWQWLFAIEGIATFLIGLGLFFYLPASPTQTKTRWNKKGWFTEREEIIIVNKVLRDDPTKSQMHNRQGVNWTDLYRSITDFDLWPLYLLGLLTFIAPATIQAYFTLTLKSLGFSTFETNMLTIPSSVLFICANLGLAFLSKKVNERVLISSLSAWWQLIFLIVLVAIPNDTDKWAKWVIISLLLAYPYAHPILVSMNSMNAGSVRTRTVSSSVYNMFVQAGTLVASNIYRTSDKPYYHRGNKVLLGIVAADIVLFWAVKTYFIWRNKQKARKWDSFSAEQKANYLETTNDKGNKRLDFRFLH